MCTATGGFARIQFCLKQTLGNTIETCFSGFCTNLRYTATGYLCHLLSRYIYIYHISPPCNLFWNSLHVGSFDWQMVCWQLEWCPWKWLLSPLHPDYCSFPTNHKMNVLRLVLLFPICLTFPLNPVKNLFKSEIKWMTADEMFFSSNL